MIMAVKYFKKEPLSAHIMEQGILNLVKWEEENGYRVDLTAAEASTILEKYFDQKKSWYRHRPKLSSPRRPANL